MNLTIILAGLLFLVAAFGGGYLRGERAKENEMAAQHATVLEGKISEHNADTVIDMAAAAEWAAKRARAQGVADGRQAALAELGRRNPPSVACTVPAAVRGVLNSAIDDANNRAGSADSVPGTLPAAPQTGDGRRAGPPAVGIGSDTPIRGLRGTAH